MALYTKRGSEIPSDAVRLAETDAIKFMRVIVESWANRSDVFYLTYGPGILSAVTALTGMYANNYYRHRLRLQSFARFSTYLPIVVVPAVISFAGHVYHVQNNLLIEKYACPVCMELKATSIQAMAGITYPMTLAPLMGFMMASRYYTYNVPSLLNDPKNVFKLYMKLSKPIIGISIGMTALHCLLAGFITYKETEDVTRVKIKLMEMESEVIGAS